MDISYPSFDERLDNPEIQSCINHPQPLVQGDPVAIWLICACFVVAALLVIGAVAWPVRSS